MDWTYEKKTGKTVYSGAVATGLMGHAERQKIAASFNGRLTVTVDVPGILAMLSERTITSKVGKSQLLGGLVVCERFGNIITNAQPVCPLGADQRYTEYPKKEGDC